MAKRRRLEAPSADKLREIEAGLSPQQSRASTGPLPPIASVAGEAAAQTAVEDTATRADAERYRKALAAGMVVETLPLDRITTDDLLRDRVGLNGEEMEELKTSITAHGLRLPIEVFRQDRDTFGLISGWRRLTALRALYQETGDPAYAQIKALVRAPEGASEAYVAMVEENEIRADLSQYERGRIAQLAAEQGAFATLETAVDALFHAGSKAKRSKIRSFALVHRALGDVLSHPTALSERQGLAVAGAIKAGQTEILRRVLDTVDTTTPEAEWAALDKAIKGNTGSKPAKKASASIPLPNGATLHRSSAKGRHVLTLEGAGIDAAFVDRLVAHIKSTLD